MTDAGDGRSGERLTAAHGYRQDPGGGCRAKTGLDMQKGEVASFPTGSRLTETATRWREDGRTVEFGVDALKRERGAAILPSGANRIPLSGHDQHRVTVADVTDREFQPSLAARFPVVEIAVCGESSSGPAREAMRAQAVAPTMMAPIHAKTSVQVSPAPPISARPLMAW